MIFLLLPAGSEYARNEAILKTGKGEMVSVCGRKGKTHSKKKARKRKFSTRTLQKKINNQLITIPTGWEQRRWEKEAETSQEQGNREEENKYMVKENLAETRTKTYDFNGREIGFCANVSCGRMCLCVFSKKKHMSNTSKCSSSVLLAT